MKSEEGLPSGSAEEVACDEISPLSISLAAGAGMTKKHKKKRTQQPEGVVIEELPPDVDMSAEQANVVPGAKHKKKKHQQLADVALMDFA